MNDKNYILFWNADNCGNSYADLLAHEKSIKGNASSSIQIAEGCQASDYLSAIYNESNCDLAYIEYTLNDAIDNESQAIYIAKCNELKRQYVAHLLSNVVEGNEQATLDAEAFLSSITTGYQAIVINESIEMFEYLHHLESTLDNKVTNT